MASVYLGQVAGEAGFSRVVAIKRLHQEYALEPDFVVRFMEEARLSGRIHHSHVVQTLDVARLDGELLLVLEYIEGETLCTLLHESVRQQVEIPLEIVSAILSGAIQGLHAAHCTVGNEGEVLSIVHRDFSPQNVMVGHDGLARVLDFGIARAATHAPITHAHRLEGKFAYMAPEQVLGDEVTPRSDIFAAGIVLWECITGRRLFGGGDRDRSTILHHVLEAEIVPPSRYRPQVPVEFDRVVLKALERNPQKRYATSQELGLALEAAVPPASAWAVGQYLERLCGDRIKQRQSLLASIRTHPPETPLAPEWKAAHRTAPTMVKRVWTWSLTGLLFTASMLLVGLHPGEVPRHSGQGETRRLEPRHSDLTPATVVLAPTDGSPSTATTAARKAASLRWLDESRESVERDSAQAASGSSSDLGRRRSAEQWGTQPTPVADPCDPPSYVGGDGIRHFKQQCL